MVSRSANLTNLGLTYHYSFNGKENDADVKGDGNQIDYGARIYDPRLGRWLSSDPMMKKYPHLSPFHYGNNNPIITIDPDGKENIIVVGSQVHQGETDQANKMNFVHQAIASLIYHRITETKETTSFLLITEGYTANQINAIKEAVTKYGGNFIEINSTSELNKYINLKETGILLNDNGKASASRKLDRITEMEFYSHGLPGEISLDLDGKNAGSAKVDFKTIKGVDKDAFNGKYSTVSSFACRTGIGVTETSDFIMGSPKPEESLAQGMANIWGVTVKAFIKRSNYKNTIGSTMDRFLLKIGQNPDFAAWRKTTLVIDGADFNPKGAYHGVVSGDTPKLVPAGLQTYSPANSKQPNR
jgi:RHS repeat-associated protein